VTLAHNITLNVAGAGPNRAGGRAYPARDVASAGICLVYPPMGCHLACSSASLVAFHSKFQ